MEISTQERAVPGRAPATFTETEAEFLAENMLGRLATVSGAGQPHVVPVAYRFDGSGVYFGGWKLEESLKFKNIAANDRVAFVVDDVVSARPWRVRGLEIRGRAKSEIGEGGAVVRIDPYVVRSWGLGSE